MPDRDGGLTWAQFDYHSGCVGVRVTMSAMAILRGRVHILILVPRTLFSVSQASSG